MLFTDQVMHNLHQKVIHKLGEIPMVIPKSSEEYFSDLVEQIIGQQLSNLVADKIISRVRENLGGKLTIENVLETSPEKFRSLGTSNAKANYIRNIAEAFESEILDFHKFDKFEDEKIIEQLTKVKGIGRWTAEMFLIFTMGRSDVFSVGDLALRKAVTKEYKFRKEPKPKTILNISKKWSPNRTLASRILWKSLNLR
jgi:DNA-3-methyladenine glycosylase II